MSRADDLRDEFNAHSQFLQQHQAGESQAALLAMQTVQAHLAELDEEIRLADARQLDIRLVGPATANRSIPVSLLTGIANRFQSMVTAAASAMHFGPQVRGVVSRLERLGQVEFIPLAPSSFRFGLRQLNRGDESQEALDLDTRLYDKAVDAFVTVAESAAAGEIGEDAQDAVRELGRGAARRMELLVRQIADSGSAIELRQHGDNPRFVRLSDDRAAYLSSWLSDFEDRLEEREIVGVLRVLDTVRGRFGIETASEELWEGRADRELLRGLVEGRTYRARIEVETRVGEHTGVTRERARLLWIDDPERSQPSALD